MITCHRNQEARCTSEISDLLSKILDESEEPAKNEPQEQNSLTGFAAALAAEAEALKDQSVRSFVPLNAEELRCIVLLGVSPSERATNLVNTLFESAVKREIGASRYCQRIIPLMRTCKAELAEVKREVSSMLTEEFFQGGPHSVRKSHVID